MIFFFINEKKMVFFFFFFFIDKINFETQLIHQCLHHDQLKIES